MHRDIEAIAKRLGFIPKAHFDTLAASLTQASSTLYRTQADLRKAESTVWEARLEITQLRRQVCELEDDLFSRCRLPSVMSLYDLSASDIRRPDVMETFRHIRLRPERMEVCFPIGGSAQAEVYKQHAEPLAKRWALEFAKTLQPHLQAALERA